jgi:hypothetical protein
MNFKQFKTTLLNFLQPVVVVVVVLAAAAAATWLMMVMIIIQFNSIDYYLCAESTAKRTITDTAQFRYTVSTV